MDLVLGLSITSKDIRGVLVDGVTGEGVQVDHAALDIPDVDAFDADAFLETLLVDGDLHAVGVTWSEDAQPAAIKVREALAVRGGDAPVVAVPDVDAVEELVRGIAGLTGDDFLVVCIVEPDGAAIAMLNGYRMAVEHIDRADSGTLIDRACAVVRSAHPSPDAIFVLGSEDTDTLVSALRKVTPRPVITAAEADFALTRGAALASVRPTDVPDVPVAAKPRISQVGVLSSVLAAAVVVFVVSLSLVVGLRVTPDPDEQPNIAIAAGQTVLPAAPPSIAKAAPAPPPVRQPIAAAPPAPVVVPPAPVAAPPAPAVVPPVPVVAPPAPPAYVPPVAPPQPRLRDRIIEKVPFLNRFR